MLDADESSRVSQVITLVNELPSENRVVLEYLVELLVEVNELAEHNLMNENNLGIVFGPNILPPDLNMQNLSASNTLVRALITHSSVIFGKTKAAEQPAAVAEEPVKEEEPAKEVPVKEQPVREEERVMSVQSVQIEREEGEPVTEPPVMEREVPEDETPEPAVAVAAAAVEEFKPREPEREPTPPAEEPVVVVEEEEVMLKEEPARQPPQPEEPVVTIAVPEISVDGGDSHAAPAVSKEEQEDPEQFRAAREAAHKLFSDSLAAYETFAASQ